MFISELDLHGFKSFAHKTLVRFDRGITAIVGPNGCGKSNIVDALRWVLGEQRPSLLRSSSMNNVIFNGTVKRKAQGMAEVSLTFINNKGLLPMEYSEVTITRRLYRSGDSEYLINNTVCRLKDIMELFMDTGMGSDAYSVIELKMVEDILDDRNNDRRRLFEEAAGITRYKEKRKQTLRKLDETLKDLQRVEDILVEVRKKARSLELQAEKAEKVKRYRTELESLDKSWNRHEYDKIQEELEPLQVRISNAEKEKKEIVQSLEQLEEKETKDRRLLQEKEREQADAQRLVNRVSAEILEMETTLRITGEKINNEKKVIEQYGKDIKQSGKDREELEALLENSRSRLSLLQKQQGKSDNSLSEARERFSEIQQQYTRERHQLYELEITSSDATREMNDLQSDRIKLESKLENTGDDLQRILNDIQDLEKRIEQQSSELDEADREAGKLASNRQSLTTQLENVTGERRELQANREELREEIRTIKSRLDAYEAETKLLEELARSKDALPSGVAWLIEHHRDAFSLIEVVGNIMHTDEEHAPALETALGETINYVIVASMNEALRGAELLKTNDQGRATFIPLNELGKDYESKKHSILSVVEVEERFRPLAQLLLGSIILAEDINQAKRLLEMGGSAAVTQEGDLITAHRFLKSGGKNNQAGVRLGLKDRLEKLEQKLLSGRDDLATKQSELEKLEARISELDTEKIRRTIGENDQQIRKWEQQQSRIQSGIQVYKKNIEDLKNRQQLLADSEGHARDKLGTLNPRQDELQKQVLDLETKQNERKSNLQKLEEERTIAQNRFNDAQLRHQDVKNKVDNLLREVKRAETGITELENRLKSRKKLLEGSNQLIAESTRVIQETEALLKEKRTEKKESDEQLAVVQEACGIHRSTINELEKDLRERRRQKEVNLELVHHLSMAREKLELQAGKISDHIWETYGILVKQIEESLPADSNRDVVRERIGWLRQKLNQAGEVNPLAIEEYQEEKERLDFLEGQVGDLHDAEGQLRETITEINETATERFTGTFEKIRENFKTVFNTLFQEDDYCDLLIQQDVDDPLEAKIEIKANPRGKRPSNISQLSGGEKTLTAIALLFAIYLVKPSPFCVLDEVDAPLDDANIDRFAGMIRKFSTETQFIIITHNKQTMSKAEMMYGVTMPEPGVSRLVGVRLDEVSDVA